MIDTSTLEGLKNTLHIESGNAHGKTITVVLEGHDISHLVTDINVVASATDAIRVELHLVKVRLT